MTLDDSESAGFLPCTKCLFMQHKAVKVSSTKGVDSFGTWHHISVALAIDRILFFDFLVFQFGELTV